MSQQWLATGSDCGHEDEVVTGDVSRAIEMLEKKGYRRVELQQGRRYSQPIVTARVSDGILRVC